jgi:NADH-quinone oxidoreductase subunit M
MHIAEQFSRLADKVVLLLVVVPLLGAVCIAGVGRYGPAAARHTALVNVGLSLVLALVLVCRFAPAPAFARSEHASPSESAQLLVSMPWVGGGVEGAPVISLAFGVDGVTLWPTVLLPLIVWSCLLVEWESLMPRQLVWLLAAQSSMTVFHTARDVVLLLVGLGLTALTVSLAMGASGQEGARDAARRLLRHQWTAWLLLAAGLAGLVVCDALMRGAPRSPPAPPSFNLNELVHGIRDLAGRSPPAALVWGQLSPWLFVCLAGGLMLWTGVFPLHAAAAAAITRASPAGQVLIGAIALKLGGYGFVRLVLPLFPDLCASLGGILFLVALWGGIVIALWLYAEEDAARLAAGSAILAGCLCLTGLLTITASGLRGGLLLLMGSTPSLALYSLVLGIARRGGSRAGVPASSGLRAAWTFAVLGLAGIPGLAMFPGLLLIVIGIVESSRVFPGGWLIVLLTVWLALALAAAGLLRRSVLPDGEAGSRSGRCSARDLAGLAPLILVILWLGLAPQTFLNAVDSSLLPPVSADGPGMDMLIPGR